MADLKIKISHGYTDYINVEVRADETVAQRVTEAVTRIIADASEISAPTTKQQEG